MSDFYEQLCNMLIRPTRQTYHLYDLGNPLVGQYGKRDDFQILSREKLKVKCSFYHSLCRESSINTQMPTVIYLHSLNGSRLEFLSNVEPLLQMGFNICTLDLSGCGLSDGSYVTLGAREKWDVLELVKYVYKNYEETSFIVWGRSMGAVAAIKFYALLMEQRDICRQLQAIKIVALVLDSPFSSLNQLAVQIAKNRISIPEIVIKMAFYMIQSSIETRANFRTSQLELQNQVKKIVSPTLIITSKKDTLVPYEHSLLIYNNIACNDKQLMYIETEHNNNRQESDLQRVYEFLKDKSKVNSPRPYYFTGPGDRKIEKLDTKHKSRQKNLTLSKDKLTRHQSHKNQFIQPKQNNFFMSHVARENPIKIEEQHDSSHQHKVRDFSVERVQVEEQKIHYDRNCINYFSADRPKIMFTSEVNQSSTNSKPPLNQSLTSGKPTPKEQKIIDLYSSKLTPVKETFVQKPFTHSLSYKNIECLKTAKKIKRLEVEADQNPNNEKEQSEEIKSHMNVITAKLKKKSKHMLTKSFLPPEMIENVHQSMPEQNQRTLRKQINTTKSSTILEYSKQTYPVVSGSFHKTDQKQKPSTPISFSTRDIHFGQNIPKPFTPQFPLHSSMRINEIQKRRLSSSKEDVMKLYSMQPANESSKGIKTTLHPKYNSCSNGSDQNIQNSTKNSSMNQSIMLNSVHQEVPRPEFMSSKNILSSQIIEMRGEPNMQKNKKYIFSGKKPIFEGKEETSISLK